MLSFIFRRIVPFISLKIKQQLNLAHEIVDMCDVDSAVIVPIAITINVPRSSPWEGFIERLGHRLDSENFASEYSSHSE